jgi:hypothetical protein
MPTDVEQVVIEYTAARNAVRELIRETKGKNLDIKPELVRRIRAAEEALLVAGEKLLGETMPTG